MNIFQYLIAIFPDPILMVELWRSQEMFQDCDVNEGFVPTAPPRKQGSGRPKGSYVLSGEVAEAVKDFMEHAGLPAHERRREDTTR